MLKWTTSIITATIITVWGCAISSAEDHMLGQTPMNPDLAVFEGKLSLETRIVDGDEDSAKFDEYTDLLRSLTGDADLSYLQPNNYRLRFTGNRVGADDQTLEFLGDWYGKISVDAAYDKLPHELAHSASTLYSGIGSDYLAINDAIQTALAPLSGDALVAQLNTYYAGASLEALSVKRNKMKFMTDISALNPFSLRMELTQEEKTGSKPLMGSFGLSDLGVDPPVEIAEPVDSKTTQVKALGEYAKEGYFVNLSYYYSQYDNKKDTVSFENPFNLTDGIFDPAAGRMALSPDNQYHSLALSGCYMGLPFNSRMTGGISMGRMIQDNSLAPYTINTALIFPFDATDPSNLPKGSDDARVDTALYHLRIVSNPTGLLRVKANFRYSGYDNDTKQTEFPGYVNNDDLFLPIPVANTPISYRHLTTGAEVGLNMLAGRRFTLGYQFDRTGRTNAQVSRENEHTIKTCMDAFAWDQADMRLSYSRSYKNIGRYDETVGSAIELPRLRKYIMADRIQDRVELLTNYYPMDALAFSPSVAYTRNDFTDSPFGLQEDKSYQISLDADWTLSGNTSVYGAFIHEWYSAGQRASEDTFTPGLALWSAETKDIFDTFIGGINITFIPKRLDADMSYTYTIANGKIDLESVSTSPLDFNKSDDATQHILHTKINYHMKNGLSLTLGHQWSKFNYDDFNTIGFNSVTANSSNVYGITLVEGLFMGTLPEDYDAHIVYAKATYSF